jgi:hypothetical protein
MQNLTPAAIAALCLELAPAAFFGFASERIERALARWPRALRVTLPALFAVPYVLVSLSAHICAPRRPTQTSAATGVTDSFCCCWASL